MHLLIDISHHGFGHIGQTAPVIERLSQLLPELTLTLRTTVPRGHLASRLSTSFTYVAKATDVGMVMDSLCQVDRGATADAYAGFHLGWAEKVENCARETEALAPDLVISNASYLALAGAARAGIPCVGYGSLNWADIYRVYCLHDQTAPAILDQMMAAYSCASTFLKLEPHLPMTWLADAQRIGPVAQTGKNRRTEILTQLGLSRSTRLVLAAFGGMPLPVDCTSWAPLPDCHFLVPADWRSSGNGFTPIDRLDLPFEDLLRSCDVVISKPGYGIVVEAACNGKPLIYVPRLDWPEEEIFVDWLGRHGIVRAITADQLIKGELATTLDDVLSAPLPPILQSTGIDEAAQILCRRLAALVPVYG